MKTRPTILSAMTPFPFTIEKGETVEQAQKSLTQHGIRHLPVTDFGNLIGIITEQDVVVALALQKRAKSKERITVGDICKQDPYIVPTTEWLDQVATHMSERHLDYALVTKDGKLVGIFTTQDACRVLIQVLPHPPEDVPDDIA